MLKVRLNQNYSGDFLTTQNGKIFYRKDNIMKKEENIVEVDENNPEIANLIKQQHLIVVNPAPVETPVKNENKEEKKPVKTEKVNDPDVISSKGMNTKNVLN